MSKEKQIEEMGKIIQKCDDEAMYASIADSLYDAGYRKQHISEGDPSNELIEIVKPYVSGCACEEESGSCELTDCRSCNALNLAKEIYNEGYRKQSEIIEDFVKRLLDAFPEGNRDARCPAIYYDDYRYIVEELAEKMKGGAE